MIETVEDSQVVAIERIEVDCGDFVKVAHLQSFRCSALLAEARMRCDAMDHILVAAVAL